MSRQTRAQQRAYVCRCYPTVRSSSGRTCSVAWHLAGLSHATGKRGASFTRLPHSCFQFASDSVPRRAHAHLR